MRVGGREQTGSFGFLVKYTERLLCLQATLGVGKCVQEGSTHGPGRSAGVLPTVVMHARPNLPK